MWEFIKENATWLIPFVSAILSLSASTVVFIIKNVKTKKGEKIAKAALSLINFAQQGVKLAEQFVNFTGEEKKAYATTMIKEWCMSSGVSYSDEAISEAIEKVIEISKTVNKRK